MIDAEALEYIASFDRGKMSKCYECTESYCPVFSPIDEPIDTELSVKDFTGERFKQWMKRLLTEPLPCGQKEKK